MWATATVVLLYSWYTTKIYFAKHKINGIPKILDNSLIEEPRWSEMSVGPRVPPLPYELGSLVLVVGLLTLV